ncbi:MAG: hypothetical protein RQ833_02870 [Sphingomonadaceae bacterium]|nr:hypothetical protein [Sphingomonadaceae bacterium]
MRNLKLARPLAAAALMGGAALAAPAFAATQPVPTVQPTGGKPQACLSRRQTSRIVALDAETLLFRTGFSSGYVSKVKGGCPYRNNFDTITFSSPSPSVCSGDALQIVTIPENVFRGACILGDFQPVQVARPAKGGSGTATTGY